MVDETIDFVIPWVDGSDPEWQAEKRHYSQSKTDDSNSVNRYRDWGLLPYWFRGVEKFTPWVNRIHFITWGHIPKFLNADNPKIHIVKHRDYIPNEYLPTFSANPIEMNMHRINGLSERFVYFNDDMFVLRPMSKNKFFKNGLPCVYGVEAPFSPESNEVWQYLLVNDVATINNHFEKRKVGLKTKRKMLSPKYPATDLIRAFATSILFPNAFLGFKNVHAPAAFFKSTFESIWEQEYRLLDATSKNKFRSVTDVNQWLPLWWQVVSGKFEPYRTDNVVKSANNDSVFDIEKIISKQSHDMICINDPTCEFDFDVVSKRIIDAFEMILPEKSGFEK